MKHLILSAIFIAITMGFSSCEKEESPQTSDFKSHTFNARTYEKWVYFSFEEGKEVEVSDFLNDMRWDIAFHRFDVRLNCGTSGKGQGGSINMGKIDFETLVTAPTEGYSLNDSIDIVVKAGEWTNPKTVPGDTVISSWLFFTGPPPQYNITNNIYVIKTAQGKYAKIWLSDFYNDNSESGFVTMQYFYQSDGSTNLK